MLCITTKAQQLTVKLQQVNHTNIALRQLLISYQHLSGATCISCIEVLLTSDGWSKGAETGHGNSPVAQTGGNWLSIFVKMT